ncbi:MAG: pyridoxal phosphate-dependent aminotransferase, partial [Myxococcales bacterium]|nr:pyridoxal phosphate-dependent aminotransferase [Myxococcales bacterium]
MQIPPRLSAHFKARQPSGIRLAQQAFARRTDGCVAINTAIGNVRLPMHPALRARLAAMGQPGGGFADGVVPYTATAGLDEANAAVLQIIRASGADPTGLYSQITEGGSQAMELTVLGACGPAGGLQYPLLMLDPAYTNYTAMARRTGRRVVSVCRTLGEDGTFSVPGTAEIEAVIEVTHPGALVVVPYDNPTGQLIGHDALLDLARLCVKHGLWFISDEAYRELYYGQTAERPSSIWHITDAEVPGIEGRRISIETASKVFNGCGLRIGALVTDNREFHERAVAEQTANLCASALGQHVFGALAHEPV